MSEFVSTAGIDQEIAAEMERLARLESRDPAAYRAELDQMMAD